MLRERYFIDSVKQSDLQNIEKISRDCRLSFWTIDDYYEEYIRTDTYSLVCKPQNSDYIIGFMIARLIMSNISVPPNKLGDITISPVIYNETEILQFAVETKFQNNRIGQILFNEYKNFCMQNQIKMIWLEVRISNHKAQNFYYKNGFKVINTRKNYYQNPAEDALIMNLNLTPELN